MMHFYSGAMMYFCSGVDSQPGKQRGEAARAITTVTAAVITSRVLLDGVFISTMTQGP
jgi:hypothetical protein